MTLDEHSHFQFLHVYKNIKTALSQKRLNDINLRLVILLDNQFSISLFCNPRLTPGFCKADKPMYLQSNGGAMTLHWVVEIGDGQTKEWFLKRAIMNILSLKMAQELYHMFYNCERGQFTIHWVEHGKLDMIFRMHPNRLHIYNPEEVVFSFVTTVEGNKLHFTKHQIEGVDKAWTLYASLGFPSERNFKWILQSNQILNCPVTIQNAIVAYIIWGPDIVALKGKTMRWTPSTVVLNIV